MVETFVRNARIPCIARANYARQFCEISNIHTLHFNCPVISRESHREKRIFKKNHLNVQVPFVFNPKLSPITLHADLISYIVKNSSFLVFLLK